MAVLVGDGWAVDDSDAVVVATMLDGDGDGVADVCDETLCDGVADSCDETLCDGVADACDETLCDGVADFDEMGDVDGVAEMSSELQGRVVLV